MSDALPDRSSSMPSDLRAWNPAADREGMADNQTDRDDRLHDGDEETGAPPCECERKKGWAYSHTVHENNPDGHSVSCPLWGPPGKENWRNAA